MKIYSHPDAQQCGFILRDTRHGNELHLFPLGGGGRNIWALDTESDRLNSYKNWEERSSLAFSLYIYLKSWYPFASVSSVKEISSEPSSF